MLKCFKLQIPRKRKKFLIKLENYPNQIILLVESIPDFIIRDKENQYRIQNGTWIVNQ